MSPRKKKTEESRSDITVIVPVLNRQNMITRCLESIRRQDYRPLDVIVVDNGSSDGTPARVRDFIETVDEDDLNVKLVYELLPGAACARNHGARMANSPYLLFFDSDDEMHPELVSEAMGRFHENPALDIVHWQCRCIDEQGKVKYKIYSEKNYWERHIYNSMFSTQSYAVRRTFLDYCGGWDRNLNCWDDWELGIRLLCHEPRIAGIPKVLVDVNVHADSITGKDFSSREFQLHNAILTSESDIEELIKDKKERRRLRRMIAYVRVVLAAHYRREGNRKVARFFMGETMHLRYYEEIIKANSRAEHERRRLLSRFERLLFRLIYFYTRHGGRGAYRLLEKTR